MRTILVTLSLALATTACATHTIQYKNPSVAAAGPTHSERQKFFLWGLVGGTQIDLPQVCPNGVAGIESKSSAMDQILTWITAGLYSPMSVDVHCGGGAPTTASGG